MKRQYLIIAILALIVPALVRGLWFYRGLPPQRGEIATPDYASFTRPQAAISTPDVEDIKALGGKVLLDGFHGNQFTPNEIEALTSAIQARGGKVETIFDSISLESQLKQASAFISVSPSYFFAPYETQILKAFTERGGRILVFTDATRNLLFFDQFSGNPIAYGDSIAANSLLKVFDISINNDYLYNTETHEGNFRNVLFDDFGKNELTFGLSEVALYGAHSVESPSGLLLLRGPGTNLSSLDDAYDPDQGGAALSADGNVAAFGDFTFLASPYNTYTDNAALIQNLADFALSGVQGRTLANFPYLFNEKTVQVYIAQDLTKTTELVTALGLLQSSMRYLDIQLEFVEDLPRSGDAIVIGSYETLDEFETYLKKFDVTIDGGDYISTTEFGEVGRYGNGLLMYEAGTKGNTLVLLADTPEEVVSMINLAGSGGLYACLSSDRLAICSVGFGGDYYGGSEEESFDGTSTEETSTETSGEATPEATPTPGG